jgi:DNA helicase IV
VRLDGAPPTVRVVAPDDLFDAVAREVIAVRHRHHNTGVVAPMALHASIAASLATHDLKLVDHVHDLAHGDVPVFTAEAVKGLEFDGVVVVNAHEIFDGSALGARLLYVAMTRAVQVLHLVGDAPPPAALLLDVSPESIEQHSS